MKTSVARALGPSDMRHRNVHIVHKKFAEAKVCTGRNGIDMAGV